MLDKIESAVKASLASLAKETKKTFKQGQVVDFVKEIEKYADKTYLPELHEFHTLLDIHTYVSCEVRTALDSASKKHEKPLYQISTGLEHIEFHLQELLLLRIFLFNNRRSTDYLNVSDKDWRMLTGVLRSLYETLEKYKVVKDKKYMIELMSSIECTTDRIVRSALCHAVYETELFKQIFNLKGYNGIDIPAHTIYALDPQHVVYKLMLTSTPTVRSSKRDVLDTIKRDYFYMLEGLKYKLHDCLRHHSVELCAINPDWKEVIEIEKTLDDKNKVLEKDHCLKLTKIVNTSIKTLETLKEEHAIALIDINKSKFDVTDLNSIIRLNRQTPWYIESAIQISMHARLLAYILIKMESPYNDVEVGDVGDVSLAPNDYDELIKVLNMRKELLSMSKHIKLDMKEEFSRLNRHVGAMRNLTNDIKTVLSDEKTFHKAVDEAIAYYGDDVHRVLDYAVHHNYVEFEERGNLIYIADNYSLHTGHEHDYEYDGDDMFE